MIRYFLLRGVGAASSGYTARMIPILGKHGVVALEGHQPLERVLAGLREGVQRLWWACSPDRLPGGNVFLDAEGCLFRVVLRHVMVPPVLTGFRRAEERDAPRQIAGFVAERQYPTNSYGVDGTRHW